MSGASSPRKIIEGISASPDVRVGKVFLLKLAPDDFVRRRIDSDEIDMEIMRLREAIREAREELEGLQAQLAHDFGADHAKIVEADMMILDDPMVLDETVRLVTEEKRNAEWAFHGGISKVIHALETIEDEYLRHRSTDVKDILRRVLRNLAGPSRRGLREVEEPVVVVAPDLSVAELAQMPREKVLAIATDRGGRYSHTAISARDKWRIPAVVGLGTVSRSVRDGDTIAVDGNRGVVVVNPTAEEIEQYREEEQRLAVRVPPPKPAEREPARTSDGHVLDLSANIESADELDLVISQGANGIGLFRTEFTFLGRKDLPDEEEQFRIYREVAERMKPDYAVIRTVDLGGDKLLPDMHAPEDNPFLGWRGVRLSLARPDIFKTQLRAILRASAYGSLKTLLPMVSGVEEMREARIVYEEVKEDLRKKSIPFDEDCPLGAMIETPSAATITDFLADVSDFFSVGSNDLVQYTLAADRGNEKVAHLYEPMHPAVLRMMRYVVETAKAKGRWVGICGEMGSDPLATFVLVGMGYDEISTNPIVLPEIRSIIAAISHSEAKEIAETSLTFQTSAEVRAYVRKNLIARLKAADGAE
jgi:phosphotransferase system enzyme I (PtsI)